MPLLDFSKNCDITTHSFSNDLLSYSLKDNKIIWENSTEENYVVVEDIFASLDGENFWTPIFCQDDEMINNKIISHYGSVIGDSSFSSGRIGIEDFINFNPQFKNWNINNGKMVIDWILNRSRSPHSIEAGLMYWKRKIPKVSGKITFFPNYSKLKYNNKIYIKLDNNTLRIISPTASIQASFRRDSTLSFKYTEDDSDVYISDLIRQNGNQEPEFILYGSEETEVWIPDGDQLLYFTNQSEKIDNNIKGIASRSYISGSLYKYYNIFYNSLTAGEKLVKLTDTRSTHRLRQYKKLAHSLSTGPFSSEFFVSLLSKPSQTIRIAIDSYLSTPINSIESDILELKNVLNIISEEYSGYEINNNSNIVKNNDQLFSKLFNKYGAKLQLSGNTTVQYKPALTYGDSIVIEEIGETLAAKNLNDTIITNNKIVSIGNLSLETSIGDSISSLLLKNKQKTSNTIALYDSVKPYIKESSNINILIEKNNSVDDIFKNNPSKIPIVKDYDQETIVFYWGAKDEDNSSMNQWLKYSPKLKAVNTELSVKYTHPKFPNQAQEMIDGEFNCVWTRVSGPDCKFVDLNKTQTNKSYNIAYSNDIMLVPSSTGKYIIKCVVSSPYGSYTKIKTIFIVDGKERLGSQQTGLRNNPDFATYIHNNDKININTINQNLYRIENVPILINKDKLQIFISGLDSVAIHRNGLFAPIRTNYYVQRVTFNSRPIEKLNENNNYLFMFDKDGMASIIPKVSNSSLTINYLTNNTIIKLDRIILRNIRNNSSQCSQCYSLYKPKFKSFIGANKRPNFIRSNKNPDAFTLQKFLPDKNIFFPSETIDYFYPEISSDNAPPIRTYGGYGNQVLDKLSINNLGSNGLPKPDRVVSNTGMIAVVPKELPLVTGYKLDYKDDFFSLDESIRNYKFCYQQNVMPTGYIEFDKGCFIPGSGWAIGDNCNLSSVLKFNPGARKSFSFAGPGILGIGNYTTNENIKANIFKSSIELNINPLVQWDDGGQFCPAPVPPLSNETVNRNRKAEIRGTHLMKNQLNKELADQHRGGPNDYHHGYRTLNGGVPKASELNILNNGSPQNDEFNIDIDEDSNKFIYSFNVVGPNNKINLDDESKNFITLYQSGVSVGAGGNSSTVRDFIENKNGLGIRDPRINNLTIKDVEVKLNFLNYVNTKNLMIWLEVEFCDSEKKSIQLKLTERGPPNAPPQIKSGNNFVDQFIPNNTHKEYIGVRNQFFTSNNIDVGNDKINKYLNKLADQNSTDIVGDNVKLYLLNQEIIQNKDYNFSIKFSDSADKHNVLYDHNSYSTGIINPDQNIISNNSSVAPSKHVDGYNTYENSLNSNLNKINRLNINNNTFHKLSNRSIFLNQKEPTREGCSYIFPSYSSSTKFTLKIAVLEEADDMFPIDTIVNNELFTNISSIDTSIVSANLFNNLCSWELILHTEDVKKPVVSQVNSLANYGGTDSLSLIEYGEEPKYPGYSFIADLKESKFLLPLVNMNAPTTFFQNYNACEYADNELIGKGILIDSPRFPTEALIFILAGTAVGGMTGTLVGALVGGLGATYNMGFQMIFDYYKESRAVPVFESAQRETFDIEYDGYPFGNSDKILLNISKDGLFWYKVEASIFKLNNTPALPLKKYSLIKSNNKLFQFNFEIVYKNSDIIDELFLSYIINKATPKDADEETRELYKNIDNNIYNSFNFMSVDELVFGNKVIHSENIFQYINKPNQTLIIIDHTIPYYLISIGDSVTLDCNNLSAIVMSKALMYKESKYITVLVLNKSKQELSQCSSLLLPENVVVVCGSENSTIETDTSSPVSLFGLFSNQPPNDNIPDRTFSTNSLGSYGDGSSVKNKNILSRKVQINHIEPIYSQLNSFSNDKYYYNKLFLVLPSGGDQIVMAPNTIPTGISISIKNELESYPVYYDSSNHNIIDNSAYHLHDNTFSDSAANDNRESIQNLLDNINTSIKDNKTYFKDYKYNMVYLKLKNNDTINKLYRNTMAQVSIENVYSYNETITRITTNELRILIERLSILNKNDDATLNNLIGQTSSTNTILASDSIFYIQQHYEILPEDSGDCSRLLPTITCYKDNTYSKLQRLFKEKNDILKLLDSQTIKKAKIYLSSEDFNQNRFTEGLVEFDNIETIKLVNNNSIFNKNEIFKIVFEYVLDDEAQKYHTGEGGIIPDQKVHIVTNTDKSVSISYENLSDNYYWINIDPKQSISIAEEMRPRILKSIKYICQNTNPVFDTGGVQMSDFNNICPDWFKVNNLENDIMTIKGEPGGTTYTFKDTVINEQKRNFEPGVWGWKTQTLERRFRINSENNAKNLFRNAEFLVTAIETYEVGLDQIEAGYKNALEAGLSQSDATELLIEEGIMKSDFSGDIYQGLNNGLGSTHNKPTRVYNIFNLDDTTKLKVQFRKAPRSIRGIDAIGTILRYGENNSYRPQNRPPLDPLDAWGIGRTEGLINNFYQWKCLQKDPLATEESGGSLLEAKTPEFFQLLNEMVFRTFFGSVDGIENKTVGLRSLYDFEMIPYEYFIKPTGV